MDPTLASTVSSAIGLLASVLSIAIPVVLWLILRRVWTPRSKKSYAMKFALWPMIFFSSQLAGPLAREIFGIQSAYSSLEGAFKGVVGLSILFGPLFFGIGYFLGRRKFPTEQSNQSPVE